MAMAEQRSNDHPQQLCTADCPLANGQLLEPLERCNAYLRLVVALQFFGGLTSFRPGQLEALLPIAHGKDCFVRMATGAGKSLCMFLVPLAHDLPSVGVVISPLNCLMDEQVLYIAITCIAKSCSTNTSVMALKRVLKLAVIGIKAVRVCRQNTGHFASVVSGEFYFGTSQLLLW